MGEEYKITVFSFTSSVLFLTNQGNHFATAVGGWVASTPPGTDIILFDMVYFWDMAGTPMALNLPERIRLNTKMAVMRIDDYKFPVPSEVTVETEPGKDSSEPVLVPDDYEPSDFGSDEDM